MKIIIYSIIGLVVAGSGATAALLFVESEWYDNARGIEYIATTTEKIIEKSEFDRLDELEQKELELQTQLNEVKTEIEAIYKEKETELEARKEQRRANELSLL